MSSNVKYQLIEDIVTEIEEVRVEIESVNKQLAKNPNKHKVSSLNLSKDKLNTTRANLLSDLKSKLKLAGAYTKAKEILENAADYIKISKDLEFKSTSPNLNQSLSNITLTSSKSEIMSNPQSGGLNTTSTGNRSRLSASGIPLVQTQSTLTSADSSKQTPAANPTKPLNFSAAVGQTSYIDPSSKIQVVDTFLIDLLDQYDTFKTALVVDPYGIRDRILRNRSLPDLAMVAFNICLLGPNPSKIISKLSSKNLDDKLKQSIKQKCCQLEDDLTILGCRGTQFQVAFGDLMIGARRFLVSKKKQLQKFCDVNIVPIEYQFPGGLTNFLKVYDAGAPQTRNDWAVFITNFTDTISQGKATVNQDLFEKSYVMASLKASDFSDIDDLDFENMLNKFNQDNTAQGNA